MHQLGKLTKNFVVLDSCNDNKRLSILFYLYSILFYSCPFLQYQIAEKDMLTITLTLKL